MEEETKNDAKYQKILTEYSKLRSQAKVLKNAVIEEKGKVSSLEEKLRIKDQQQRRLESEIDSINFRNKQLEHRVSVIQEELHQTFKSKSGKNSVSGGGSQQVDPIIVDELQKKIFENAQLSSAISDKNNEIEMLTNRLKDMDLMSFEHLEKERKMRKEIETLNMKTSDLESKLVEAASQNGSDGDGISLAASDSTIPIHMTVAPDERIQFLEKELNYYRTQYELLKINDALKCAGGENHQSRKILSSQSSTSSSVSVGNNLMLTNANSTITKCVPSLSHNNDHDSTANPQSREQMIYDYFTKRLDELFNEKCKSDSKAINYMNECESLKENVEILLENLQEREAEVKNFQTNLRRLEEDFSTTRINYDEQIQVMTEQVISLSSQLAANQII